MTHPEVSVVIGVYNGGGELSRTLDSVLAQQGVDLELIVVDDGSTDDTPRVLAELAKADARVRVFRQEKLGLTRALMRGCAEARGELIARQDVGDVSDPRRLRLQLEMAKLHPEAGLFSCWVQFKGPEGEPLYRVSPEPEMATERLRRLEPSSIEGPAHHGTALFRKSLYEEVGGYRSQFYFAQDLDLWTRFVEHGGHVVIPEVLYEAAITLGSLTQRHRSQQFATAQAILECARRRREGSDETDALRAASLIRPTPNRPVSSLAQARSLYFIGSCLKRQGDRRAKGYFRRALIACPVHFRSLVGWALT